MPRRGEGPRRGWDPLLIISQIVGLQACHYLFLALITPPLLYMFANPLSLSLEGGASNVAMIMDWREMVGKATIEDKVGDYTRLPPGLGRQKLGGAGSGSPSPPPIGQQQRQEAWSNASPIRQQQGDESASGERDMLHAPPEDSTTQTDYHLEELLKGQASPLGGASDGGSEQQYSERYYAADPIRGWVLGVSWIAASSADILYIYHLIRRPTHILDFSLTLVFNHIVLTTYYASSFPTSLFFWAIVAGSAAMQIIWAEQLCVRREMKEGFILGQGWKTDERNEDSLPMHSMPRRQRRNSAPSAFQSMVVAG